MEHALNHEDLMRYLDGELSPAREAEVEAHLAECAECRRELSVFRELSADLEAAPHSPMPHGSVWGGVQRQLTRPLGWVLFAGGLAVWAVYAIYVLVTAPTALWMKLAEGAIIIGLAILLGSVLREHYIAWRTDPYRDIER